MKKILSVLLTCAMLAGMCTAFAVNTAATPVTGIDITEPVEQDTSELGSPVSKSTYNDAQNVHQYGDIDDSGTINAADILVLRLHNAGTPDLTGFNGDLADCNNDGNVNASDILALRLHIATAIDLEHDFGKNGFNIRQLTIEGVSIADYVIVVPEGSTEDDNIHYAAEEMQDYIKWACGFELPIVYGSSDGAPCIFYQLDPTGSTEGETYAGTPGELGTEGFIIEITDGNVIITGGTMRGNMYGTYEFLEAYIGYRFMGIDFMFLYNASHVNLENCEPDKQVPILEDRAISGYQTFGSDSARTYAFPRKLNERAGMYGAPDNPRYGRLFGRRFLNAHSFYFYRHKFVQNGENSREIMEKQPCFSTMDYDWDYEYNYDPVPPDSYPDEYTELINGMCKTMRMVESWNQDFDPAVTQFSFSINDNTDYSAWYCKCVYCRNQMARGETWASMIIRYASAAADLLQTIEDGKWAGIKLFTIIYDHNYPTSTTPLEGSDYLIVMYCGTGCDNHAFGSGECGDGKTGMPASGPGAINNNIDEQNFPRFCDATATTYYWHYATNFHYYLSPCPNYFSIRETLRNVVEAGCDGFYIEGGCSNTYYNFEAMREYLSALLTWDPYMSEEEYIGHMQEYLRIMYGDGWQYIYEYICMAEACGDAAGCFINNHDRPFDMYSPEYLRANYETMRELLVNAYNSAKTDKQKEDCYKMKLSLEMLGLSATYGTNYLNGSPAQRATFEARYTEWFEYLHYLEDNMPEDEDSVIFSSSVFMMPDELDFAKTPIQLIYEYASWKNPNLVY